MAIKPNFPKFKLEHEWAKKGKVKRQINIFLATEILNKNNAFVRNIARS